MAATVLATPSHQGPQDLGTEGKGETEGEAENDEVGDSEDGGLDPDELGVLPLAPLFFVGVADRYWQGWTATG